MPERFPPIEPVRTRGATASHEGARRQYDDQAVGYLADEEATFASIVRGMWHARSGRPIADLILDHGLRMFRERTASMLDDLAELWWTAEHDGARVRPFASLPIRDRADLRARVKRLLVDRVPDALGDQAVLEGETKRLLEMPAKALRRADQDLERRVDRDRPQWAGAGGALMSAIFVGGQMSLAHAGDCRAVRLRRGILDQLTREHTIARDYDEAQAANPALERPDYLPANIITRVVGALNARGPDLVTTTLHRGDLFLFMTRGLWAEADATDLKTALQRHGVEAAPRLIDDLRGSAEENIAAVAVEIL